MAEPQQIDPVVHGVLELLSIIERQAAQLAAAEALCSRFEAMSLALISTLVPFSESRQAYFCVVCRYRDPLGLYGTKLHADECPVYELHAVVDESKARGVLAGEPSQ